MALTSELLAALTENRHICKVGLSILKKAHNRNTQSLLLIKIQNITKIKFEITNYWKEKKSTCQVLGDNKQTIVLLL